MPEKEPKLDETVPGGVYINADGVKVNANGEPIKEKKDKAADSGTPTPDNTNTVSK